MLIIINKEKEMVSQLLPIVLDKNRAPHLDLFVDFLSKCNHQRITLDQWDSFLQFNHTIKMDLSNYEDDGACNNNNTTFTFNNIYFNVIFIKI